MTISRRLDNFCVAGNLNVRQTRTAFFELKVFNKAQPIKENTIVQVRGSYHQVEVYQEWKETELQFQDHLLDEEYSV
jgi:hypothetical protein